MIKRLILPLFFLLVLRNAFAQKDKNITYSLSLGDGYVLPTNKFLKGHNVDNQKINNIKSVDFTVTKTLDNSKAWQKEYNDLRYGLGLYYCHFNYSKNLNNPLAVYGLIGFSPIKTKRFTWKNQVGLGFSFLWDGYDKEINPYNVAVSKNWEAYVNWSFVGSYAIKNGFFADVGFNFVHFSNGATIKPNKGINIISPSLGFSYRPTEFRYNPCKDNVSKDYAINHLVSSYYGIHAEFVEDSIQNRSSVFGIQYRALLELSYKYNFGLGFDFTCTDAIGKNMVDYYSLNNKPDIQNKDRLSVSTFLSFMYDINRLSVIIEPGVYLYKSSYAYFPKYYQRIGAKYDVYHDCFVQIALRAYNFHIADYIEAGLGYKFVTH